MAVNSSNATHLPLPTSSSPSVYDFMLSCFHTTMGVYHMTGFTITNVLLLPVYVFILHLGHQRWRQQRTTSTMSHSDFITYNIIILELVNTVGLIFCCYGVYTGLQDMIIMGVLIFPFKLMGQMLFNIVTCGERYLAVVHPVTYLSLRTEKGIRVRNIIIAGIWVFNVAVIGSVFIVDELALTISSAINISSCILLILFFSVSVLCVLIRPKPGAGDRQKVDQSKLRAFYVIVTILGLLLLRSGGNILSIVKSDSLQLGKNEKCGMWFSIVWLSLPSTLLFPLLYLQRAGKLSFCKKYSNSG